LRGWHVAKIQKTSESGKIIHHYDHFG